jgi:tetratricopeptide (TPR) repeat protein
LTWALVQSLKRAEPAALTYAQLHAAAAQQIFKPSLPPAILGDSLEIKRKLFSHPPALADSVYALAANIEKSELLDQAIRILKQLLNERNNVYPEGHVNMGVAFAAKGDYKTSISFLEEAASKKNANYNSEAHYHLGRVLLESGIDLEKAASELGQAIALDSLNIPAYYYFGKAVRALSDKDLSEKAEEHWQKYFYNGAPLGFDEEVQAFLEARQAEKQKR